MTPCSVCGGVRLRDLLSTRRFDCSNCAAAAAAAREFSEGAAPC